MIFMMAVEQEYDEEHGTKKHSCVINSVVVAPHGMTLVVVAK
jgi:hypothetical protein